MKLIFTLLFFFSTFVTYALESSAEDQFVAELLGKMTIEEKIGQMNQLNGRNTINGLDKAIKSATLGSVLNVVDPKIVNHMQRVAVEETRLGIPILFARDVIHGFKTILPIPLGQAATFSTELVEQGARIAAEEATSTGIRWAFSPMIDVSRDGRWGRIAESYGEDVYMNSVMGVATVKGYQNNALNSPTSMAACAKHFVGYGASEGGLDYNSTYIPERQMRNVYLPPFKHALDAGAATVMVAFNDNDGVPSTANKELIRGVLRDEWNFDGVVVSDWASIVEMVNHGFAADGKNAAQLAAAAGVDMDMESRVYIKHLKKLIEEGSLAQETIDSAVENILRLKYRLGLFDNPYIANETPEFYSPKSLAVAKRAATESLILLKNENATLPISDEVERILVVGPMADAPHDQLGTWVFDGEKNATITPIDALNKNNRGLEIEYIQALTHSRDKNTEHFAKVKKAARKADMVLLFVGEESILSGEAHSLSDITLKGAQSELVDLLSECKKPLVTVVMAGRAIPIEKELASSSAMLYSFHAGTMGGEAIVDVLFGDAVPSGKTPVSFPKFSGQNPIYYAKNMTGRPARAIEQLIDEVPREALQTSTGCRSFYLDAGTEPLIPFGYGLSYTEFEYSDLKLDKNTLSNGDTINVSCKVSNTGNVDAYESVQLYVRDVVGSITRPVKELKGFQKVFVKSGSTVQVNFALPVSDLAFYNINMKYCVEPGKFDLWLAPNSKQGLHTEFKIK